MNTKRSSNANRIKNFGLAACAIMALGVMTAGEAAAQCRFGGGNAGYNNGYGGSGYQGYSNQRPSLSLGLSYNSNRNSGFNSGYGNYRTGCYNTGAYSNRSGYGNNYHNNNQQPVAYRHGNHIDVEDGNRRLHLSGRGY